MIAPVAETTKVADTIGVTLSQLRKHMYLQGLSGYGKSELLKLIVLQCIAQGVGMTVLDGVGAVVPAIVDVMGALNMRLWLDEAGGGAGWKRLKENARRALMQRFVVVDFGDEDCGGYRWNPLQLQDGLAPSEVAGDVIRCLERVFETDIDTMRRLQTLFRCILTVLAEQGGTTLFDMVHFLCFDTESVAEYLRRLEGKRQRGELAVEPQRMDLLYLEEFFAQTTGRERRELVQSSFNALNTFLSDRRVARFLSSPEGNIDFTEIVERGKFCAINLPAGGPEPKTPKILGSLIANRLQLVAEARAVDAVKRGDAKLHVLIADEFQNFFGKHWAEAAARVRNKGLALVVSHQTPFQPPFNEDPSLLQAFKDNCSTHMFFRCSYDAAEREAAAVYQPKGLLEKRNYIEVTQTEGWSRSKTVSVGVAKQIALAISESVAEGEQIGLSHGDTITVGQSHGVSWAKSKNWTVAESDTWSHAENHTEGWSVTRTRSQTILRGQGSSHGTANSHARGVTAGRSSGHVTSSSDGIGSFMSFSNGRPDPAGMALGLAGSSGKSSSSGTASAFSSSEHQATSSMVGQAVSNLISLTHSKGTTKGTAKSRSRSRGTTDAVGGSRSVSRGEAISKALSAVETHTRALARSVTRSASLQRSQGVSRTEGETRSVSLSEQEGQSGSTSRTHKQEFYSVQEETQIYAQEMANLKSRELLIRISGDEPCAYKAYTLDMPQRFFTKLGARDFAREALAMSAPAQALPAPADGPLDRLRLDERQRVLRRDG